MMGKNGCRGVLHLLLVLLRLEESHVFVFKFDILFGEVIKCILKKTEPFSSILTTLTALSVSEEGSHTCHGRNLQEMKQHVIELHFHDSKHER